MNKIMPNLITAKALPNYKIMLVFEDGVIGEIDLNKFKGNGVFNLWNDVDYFSKVYVSDHGSIAWSEEIEIDTLNCYLKLTNQTFEEYARN